MLSSTCRTRLDPLAPSPSAKRRKTGTMSLGCTCWTYQPITAPERGVAREGVLSFGWPRKEAPISGLLRQKRVVFLARSAVTLKDMKPPATHALPDDAP